jgi:hypothetical protein
MSMNECPCAPHAQDPVNLVLYSDGLQIHSLPAKPFDDPATANVLKDVMDG